jgi:hypothetical protein
MNTSGTEIANHSTRTPNMLPKGIAFVDPEDHTNRFRIKTMPKRRPGKPKPTSSVQRWYDRPLSICGAMQRQ